jgi:hypothetical protein
MSIPYHVTPITPNHVLLALAGRHFMVRYGRHEQLDLVQSIAASIVYDNGAYGVFVEAMEAYEAAKASGLNVSLDDFLKQSIDWNGYYGWVDPLLDNPTSWAIIPDEIGKSGQEQDMLLKQWPHGKERGAPVWHMDEPIGRLLRLIEEYPRVCIGSTGEYWQIWVPGRYGLDLNPDWEERMDEVWEEIERVFKRTPYTHGLRMLGVLSRRWPLASGDASNYAQNHPREGDKHKFIQRLDGQIAPPRFIRRKKTPQFHLFD